jgi:DNA-binding LacI/PurR family transcriptional regulator
MTVNIAIYKQIASDIRREIDNGNLKPDDQIMSISQLREKYDISHVTALKVFKELNQEGYITASKGKGYFVANRESTGGGGRKTGTIGLFIRPLREYSNNDNFFNDINYGIVSECGRMRLNFIGSHCTAALNSKSPETAALAEIKRIMLNMSEQVDGYLVDKRVPDEIINEVKQKTGKSMVVICRNSDLDIDCVVPEYRQGPKEIIAMMLRLGYNYFIVGKSGIEGIDTNERGDYYKSLLRDNGIENAQISEFNDYYLKPLEETCNVVKNILKKQLKNHKVGILTGSDAIARDLCEYLIKKGYTPGREFGIASYGNYGYAKNNSPAMTTVDVFPEKIGAMAVKLLSERISNGRYAPYKEYSPESAFVFGETI